MYNIFPEKNHKTSLKYIKKIVTDILTMLFLLKLTYKINAILINFPTIFFLSGQTCSKISMLRYISKDNQFKPISKQ